MSSTIEDVKAAIATTFDIPVEAVRADSSSEAIEQWDSIGHINLVMALEQRLGLKFTIEEIMEMKTIAAICKVVESKRIGAGRA